MSMLAELGLDEETVQWQDLAACKNIVKVVVRDESGVVGVHEPGEEPPLEQGEYRDVFDPLFDAYEMDVEPYPIRQATDGMCLACPVRQVCLDAGVRNSESGVWGGWYLSNGKIDDVRNGHKDFSIWRELD